MQNGPGKRRQSVSQSVDLPVVSGVNQPGAVTSWRVEVGVVWRSEGTVEVPQPFSTGGNLTVDLVSQILNKETQNQRRR